MFSQPVQRKNTPNTIHIYVGMMVVFLAAFLVSGVSTAIAATSTLSGTVYENDGVTSITSGVTVTATIADTREYIGTTTVWTARTALGTDDEWKSVTYGSSTFVAVADTYYSGGDAVMTSPDGITWTARTAAGDNDRWQSVTYGNGLFVAVGNPNPGGDAVMTSPDGITWTARTVTGDTGSWTSVTYGNGLFVAVRDYGDQLMTSPDGINWTLRNTPVSDNSWQSITFGNDLFVAVGDLNGDETIMTSPDGITWTARSAAGDDDYWTSITYGNSLFVAVGSDSGTRDAIMTSPDGITWTPREPAVESEFWDSVTYGNGVFVAVATYSQVMISDDGINWIAVDALDNNDYWASVTYGSGRFVAVAGGGSQMVMTAVNPGALGDEMPLSKSVTSDGSGQYTIDPIIGVDDWTARTAAGDDDSWTSVTYGNGLFVGVGDSGDRVMTSPDGITWTTQTAAGNDDSWTSVTYGTSTFVAVSDSGDRVMTSSDGINWTARTAAGDNDMWTDVTYGNGLFVAVGYSGDNLIMTSPDGITWTARSAPDEDTWTSVTYGNGLFVAVGEMYGFNVLMTSPDGITWTERSIVWTDYWQSVTYGNGLFVAVGNSDVDGHVMTSPDGISWTSRSAAGDDDYWQSVTYGNGLFVAVGSSSDRVMTSPDGITWTIQSAAGDDDNWQGIAYGNDTFVAVGGSGDRVMTARVPVADALVTLYVDGDAATKATTITQLEDGLVPNDLHLYADTVSLKSLGTLQLTEDTIVDSTRDGNVLIEVDGNYTTVPVDFRIEAGTYEPTAFLNLAGDFTNLGTFTAGASGYVYLDGTSQQVATGTLSGTSAFRELIIENTSGNGTSTPAVIFGSPVETNWVFTMKLGTSAQFTAGATNTFERISITGAPDNEVYLRSTVAGEVWFIDVPGEQISVEYINVKDSHASSTIFTTSSTDGGNNTNWDFPSIEIDTTGAFTGTLYENDGVTPITTTRTIVAAVAGANSLTRATTTDASGNFSINPLIGVDDWHVQSYYNSFNDVTYGAGQFVGVDYGRVMTSPDGIIWTVRNAVGNNDNWQGVTYGNGLFVAVGYSGDRVMTSPDGITWTARTAAGDNDGWESVTYGNGLFVAVEGDYWSGDDSVMTSPDGIIWTAREDISGVWSWKGVTYGEGLFVAVGDSDNKMTSPDGITWTDRGSGSDFNNRWMDVTYGNGQFVAVGFDGDRVMTSPDGITWTTRSAAGNNDNWESVTYGNGQFVAVGCGTLGCNNTTAGDRVMTSPDGITWIPRTAAGNNDSWNGVAYGNNTFVAVGDVGDDRVITASVPADDAPVTIFVDDNETTKASTVTRLLNALPPEELNLYQDVLRIQSSSTIDLSSQQLFTATDDDDVVFDINGVVTTVTGDLQVASGTMRVGDRLELTGDFSNQASIDMSTAKVFLTGTEQQLVSGSLSDSNAFNDLTVSNSFGDGTTDQSVVFESAVEVTGTYTMEAGSSAQFLAGATSTLQNINLEGVENDEVYLRSSSDGNAWYLEVPAEQINVEYVNVKDSQAASLITANNSTNAGNNSNWSFTTIAAPTDGIFSGTLYENDGTTPITTGKTIAAVIADSRPFIPNTTIWEENAWTAHSAAGDDDSWYDVAYGNGIYVAVGYQTGVMTSPDGITWTQRSVLGDNDGWQGITYGNGLFVAVGYSGDRVMTSPDGINWTARSAAGDDDYWNDVTYGNGLFVAVSDGNDDYIMTSPDGINWTARTGASYNYFYSVTYGNGLFVAVGGYNDVMTSPDGINWTTRTPDEYGTWYGVTYGNGLFVGVGYQTGVMTSLDGVTWTVQSAAGDDEVWMDVVYASSTFVAVSYSGTDTVMTSPDGITWTGYSEVGNDDNWSGITFGNGLFVTVGDAGDRVMTALAPAAVADTIPLISTTTSDGSGNYSIGPIIGVDQWTAQSAAGDDDSWNSVTYGNGTFVAVGSSSDRIMTSLDGVNWTAQDAAGDDDAWNSVTYGSSTFVAVGSSGDRVMTSPDGITWTARSAAGDDDAWQSVVYGNGLFVAIGSSGDPIMTSPDGITWTVRTGVGNLSSVTYGEGLFVAVTSAGNLVLTSPDGITWTARSAAGNNDTWNSVTYGSSTFVAVSSSGDRVMTSPDGITWTARNAAGNNDGWSSVTYGSGLFVAVGNSGDRVMTSPDGITWTARNAAGNNDTWNSVAYGNSTFVAVGDTNDRVMTAIVPTEDRPVIMYVNDDAVQAATVTYSKGSSTITGMDLYQDTMRLQHSTLDGEIDFDSLDFYDATNDPDVPFTITSDLVAIGSSSKPIDLRVATGTTFVGPEDLHLYGSFAQNGEIDFSNTDLYVYGDRVQITGALTGSNSLGNIIATSTGSADWTPAVVEDEGSFAGYAVTSGYSSLMGTNIFVAAGGLGSGKVAISVDGITWTALPLSISPNDIIYADGQFVIVGLGFFGITPGITTSPDGITWTTRSATGDNDYWTSVTYGNGQYVAVGTAATGGGGDRVMTSPDGITWTVQSAVGNDDNWNSVTYANGLFVAVGSGGTDSDDYVMTSLDGITWTARSAAGNNDSWNGVTYHDGLFVAVGGSSPGINGDRVMTSPDGITWTVQSAADATAVWSDVSYAADEFISVGYTIDDPEAETPEILGLAMTSPDGVNWELEELPSAQWMDVVYANHTVVAVSATGTTPAVALGPSALIGFGVASTSDLTITEGVLVISTTSLSIAGDLTNNGILNVANAHVYLDGTSQQIATGTLSGTNTFNNLTITNVSGTGTTTQSVVFGVPIEVTGTFAMIPGTSAQFPAGATSTLQNIDLQGTVQDEVYLRSSNDGNQWYLDVPGEQVAVEYVNVKDSYASFAVTAASSTDAGNNTNWTFGTSTESSGDSIFYDAITIDHTNIASDLTDFPVYIDLADLSSQFWEAVHEDGGNIRIFTDDLSTELPREIVTISKSTESGELHFKANHIDADTDTVFRIYYEEADEAYAVTDTYGRNNVWSNGFIAVYHLEEDGSVTSYADATGNGNTGTPQSVDAADKVSGALSSGLNTDGAPEGATIADSTDFDWNEGAISGWMSVDSLTTDGTLAVRGAGATSEMLVWFDEGVDDLTCGASVNNVFYNGSSGGSYTTRSTGEWLHGFCSWDGNDLINYVNGAANYSNTTPTGSLDNDSVSAGIAREPAGARNLDGQVDEVRFHSVGRDATWVSAEYLNQSVPTDFYIVTAVAISNSVTMSEHDAGQVENVFSFQDQSEQSIFAFKLTPNASAATTTELVLNLTGVKKVAEEDFPIVELFDDGDGNGEFDQVIDTYLGSGTVSINEDVGTIIFTNDFAVTESKNYIVVASVNGVSNGSFMTISLPPDGISIDQAVSGSISPAKHLRNNRGGGGSAANAIGGAPPAGDGDVGGGTEEAGEEIGNDPNYKQPTAHSGNWNNGANAYDQTDGTYATGGAMEETHQYSNYDFITNAGQVISGLEVKLESSMTIGSGAVTHVSLSWDGGTSWTENKSTPALSTTDAVAILGGPSDTWGRTWSVSDLSNANFRVRLGSNLGPTGAIKVDEIRIRAYLSNSGGSSGGGGDI